MTDPSFWTVLLQTFSTLNDGIKLAALLTPAVFCIVALALVLHHRRAMRKLQLQYGARTAAATPPSSPSAGWMQCAKELGCLPVPATETALARTDRP